MIKPVESFQALMMLLTVWRETPASIRPASKRGVM